MLADNRLALDAGWDEQILRIELQNLVLDSEIDVSVPPATPTLVEPRVDEFGMDFGDSSSRQ